MTESLEEALRQLADRVGLSTGDVEWPVDAFRGLECCQVGPSHVPDVDEVPHLSTVFEDARCVTPAKGAHKKAGDTGVRRVHRAPRTENIVVAKRDDRSTRFVSEDGAQVLLVDLGGGVDIAGVKRGILTHTLGDKIATARGAHWLERPRPKSFGLPWAGTDWTT